MTARRLSLEQIIDKCSDFGILFVADARGNLFLTCELVFDIEELLSDELLGAIIRCQAEILKKARVYTAEQLEASTAERFDARAPAPEGGFRHNSNFRLSCGELRAECDRLGFSFAKNDAGILFIGSDRWPSEEIDAAMSDRIFGAVVRNRVALLKIARPLDKQLKVAPHRIKKFVPENVIAAKPTQETTT